MAVLSTEAERQIENKIEKDFVIARGAPQEFKDSQDQIEEAESRFRRREIILDDTTRSSLEGQLRLIIEGWREDRSSLRTKLREWNDLYEGVTTVTDFPWIGASHVHIPIPKIKIREIRSAIDRSTMRPTPFLHATYAGPRDLFEESKDFVGSIENFTEDKLKNATNIHSILVDSLIPIMRDGTCAVEIVWDTEWEGVFDFKTYENSEEFITDYPTAKNAGISQKKYAQVVDQLNLGQPFEIRYEYEVATYDGPRASIVPLIDFVHWPVFITDLSEAIVHGKRVWKNELELENMMAMGKFTNEQQVIDTLAESGDERVDEELRTSRDQIEGISRQKNKQDAKEFEFFRLVLRMALTDEDKKMNRKRKYLCWYREKNNQIYHIEPYPVRKGKDSYFLLRFVKRDNRLLGMSFMDDISDLSFEIDIVHRQRTNTRTITHVPSFKAKEGAKSHFDPSDRKLRFRPGVVFWLKDIDDVSQFDIRPVDLSGSIDDELLLLNFIDQVLGTIGQSGQGNPIDPRAPARKEQQQVRQSTNRLEDYVAEILPTFSKIGQHVLDLYYQFGPNRIKFFSEDKDGNLIEQQIERTKLFNPNVMFRVNGTSVFASPELEFQRMLEIYSIIGQDPITAPDPKIRRNSLGRLLRAGRVQDIKDLLPPAQTTEQAPSIESEEEKDRQNRRKAQEQKESARLAEQKLNLQGQLEKEGLRAEGNLAVARTAQNGNTPPTGAPPGIPPAAPQGIPPAAPPVPPAIPPG